MNKGKIKTFPDKQKLRYSSPPGLLYKKCKRQSLKLKWKDDR